MSKKKKFGKKKNHPYVNEKNVEQKECESHQKGTKNSHNYIVKKSTVVSACVGLWCKVKKKIYSFGKNKKYRKEVTDFFGAISIVIVVVFFVNQGVFAYKKSVLQAQGRDELKREQIQEKFETDNISTITAIQDSIAIDTWQEFKSQWYGFTIKYPQDWTVRTVRATAEKNKAVYRVGFYKPMAPNADVTVQQQIGYEVAVYDVGQVKELFDIDEFPQIKDASLVDTEVCKTIPGHLIDPGDYPAEEVYIAEGDDCYDPTLFFSLTNGQYMYSIVPVMSGMDTLVHDPLISATDIVPEYFMAVAQFANINIVRPRPKPAWIANAPIPVVYVKDGTGRRICNKKNDKPGKSNQNKKKHMDMECCLDPDEYPNPHCHYDAGKYGKYMNNTP